MTRHFNAEGGGDIILTALTCYPDLRIYAANTFASLLHVQVVECYYSNSLLSRHKFEDLELQGFERIFPNGNLSC